ncbi:MAG: glycosyltransferase family 2 protein [candidate division WS1 bacterium]|jgi:glycosyltransferase involved in cell wall biosynthesis|nr:glycosyltransferase family 2 protein [candidate division WS1 bacterium]
MLLSVIMPVYNEAATVEEIVCRVLAEPHEKELIIVDDGSTDGTSELLQHLASGEPRIRLLRQDPNQGKGAAVRRGLEEARGDILLIQDADLEYDPADYSILLKPIEEGRADAVYGSRFLGVHRAFLFWHLVGNRFLTFLTNLLYNATLTDMETCYKAIRREFLEGVRLRSNTFDIEPEITAKLLKRRARLYEVPISYYGRDFSEGKKIHWHDGLRALWTLLKYRFLD